MRRAVLGAALVLALALAACGGESGDLLAVEVRGGPAGSPDRTIVVTGDGRARCDGGPLEPIDSERLIEARAIERDLKGLAERGTTLGGEASGDRRAYVARTRAGTVRWTEREPAKGSDPSAARVLPQTELLALRLGRELC